MVKRDVAASLVRLHQLVVEALALSDALGCDEIGVALDMARVSVEARLAGANDPHAD